MKNIEIEFRARFSEEKYNELKKFFQSNAEDLGEDDKDTMFYIVSDKLFKVVNEISKGKAKMVLKSSRIEVGSDAQEWEIKIDPDEFEKAIDMFNHLGISNKSMQAWQKRHNYLYKGIEIALKYSEYWEYHIEMEIVINDINDKNKAEEKIKEVASELRINLMTDEDVRAFIKPIEDKL